MDAPSQTESTMLRNPTLSQANRRVFLSRPLTQDLRISGAPVVHLDASLSTPQSNLGALLVDYADSSFPEVDRLEGVNTGTAIDCWGPSDTTNGDYDSCYRQVTKDVTNVTQWRVTSGILDSSNRTSLTTATPVTPGELTHFDWPLVPSDYTFAAGHRIGIVLVANHRNFLSINGTTGATITMDAKTTTVTLPIVGGATAAVDSGAFARDSVAPTLSGVPSDTTVPAQDAAGARVDYTEPTATDDETPQPAVGCSPASGSVFGIGSTTVTCTATDADGNSASSSFAIEVKAPPAPPTPPTPLAQPAPEPVATPAAAAPPAPPRPLPPALRRLRLQSLAHGVRVRFSLTKRDTVTLTLSTGRGRELRTVRLRAGRGEHVRTLGSAGLREGRRYVVDVAGVQAPRTLRRELTFHGAPFRCPLARDSAAQLRPRVCRP
jgi:X-Pro dipeptidyl-peptidase